MGAGTPLTTAGHCQAGPRAESASPRSCMAASCVLSMQTPQKPRYGQCANETAACLYVIEVNEQSTLMPGR